ncbi:zf-DHHC-domain-containing protein [Sodiomyces alkalinus F11]|uniref:Palmitoyltransferase n=1 Tax=Sodiomyces alkalinus (strain CBS 110278 / VKM F-3762 / F11) TaxID=1314773 RepID=A0A3N2QAB5_SODAK|nr:zf-DHHC-domain-containing protein [Sodiomyces alkalinus F11]ROT43692.1 zf-DHHC-domain-containing protein [Sodiomyces alkalinus F11]
MARRWARRVERGCCLFATYLPLTLVYGLTTWALWVDVSIGSLPTKMPWIGTGTSIGAVIIYALLNWSYTTAVFTDPGSTTNKYGYSELPTEAPPVATSFTVKSNGEMRFCKKCQARKPDRAHHCSSCRRCVLKMDHHCPWLATCVGLRNHKAFLLFLIYTTLLCFYSFALAGAWTYVEIIDNNTTYVDALLPINLIILSVVAGIIGVVIGAFTGWHVMLAGRGQTTIECLEKTRYLSPLRKTMESRTIRGMPLPGYGRQLIDMHANALPGITRPEEGEEMRRDPAGRDGQRRPMAMSYEELERQRARKRYEEYLDEQDSKNLPSAFDLGFKRNLLHLFGPSPLLWFVPVCNTTGDGWSWEPSPKWLAARERIAAEREAQRAREVTAGWGAEAPPQFYAPSVPLSLSLPLPSPSPSPSPSQFGAGRHYLQPQKTQAQRSSSSSAASPSAASPSATPSRSSPLPSPFGRKMPSKADRVLGRDPNLYADGPQEAVSMQRLNRKGRALEDELGLTDENYEDDDEEEEDDDDDEKYRDDDVGNKWGDDGENSRLVRKGGGTAVTKTGRKDEVAAVVEHRTLNLVTNGNNWRRGGASGLLRTASHSPVATRAAVSSKDPLEDDDTVD